MTWPPNMGLWGPTAWRLEDDVKVLVIVALVLLLALLAKKTG